MLIRRVQRRLPSGDVRLRARDPLRPLEDFPESIQREVNRDTDVCSDEAVLIKGPKGVEAVEKSDDGEENQREPRGIWLEGGFEDQGVAVDALGLEGGVEADVGNGDGHPGEERGDGDEVLEPFEDDVGARGAGHVS